MNHRARGEAREIRDGDYLGPSLDPAIPSPVIRAHRLTRSTAGLFFAGLELAYRHLCQVPPVPCGTEREGKRNRIPR